MVAAKVRDRRNIKAKHYRNVNVPERNQEIDLALAVLCAIQKPGEVVSVRTIAEVTGMSHEGPRAIERRALKKFRRKLDPELVKRFMGPWAVF